MANPTQHRAQLTIRAYAQYRGRPEAIIQRELKRAGLRPPIDPAIADPLLDAATPEPRKKSAAWKTVTARGADISYNEAERRLRLAQAEQQELKLAKLRGTLVLREAVERDAFAMGRRVRDSLENLPARLSGLFAAELDQSRIFVALSREIQQCLESLTTTAGQRAITREARAQPQPRTRRAKRLVG